MGSCPFCSRTFTSITSRHKSVCDGWPKTPPPEPCLCGHVSTSGTQQKRHQSVCDVWKARDKKAVYNDRKRATSIARYGVENATQAPEVVARRKATNVDRYGAENPFSKEASTFKKVQNSLVGKRIGLKGENNPFAWPEVQTKLRESMTEKYGAPNPQQVPEIRAKSKATNLERYGGEMLGSPVLRTKSDETNLARYGSTEPSRNPEVVERIRMTNVARYGVNWTNQDPDIRRRQLETMHERYGSHFFASEEGKREVREALMEKYGVEFPSQIEGNWEKTVATFQEKYGVDHPLQLKEFRDKQRSTNELRYGNPFPGLSPIGPNGLERRVWGMDPRLLFTGDGAFWKLLPKLGRYKNPDFILPGPDPSKPKKGVTKVVEVFGDFWHSRMFTGKAPFDHEQELIDAFLDIDISCLILWESEVKKDPKGTQERLARFISPGVR